jgi:hypothetical protein
MNRTTVNERWVVIVDRAHFDDIGEVRTLDTERVAEFPNAVAARRFAHALIRKHKADGSHMTDFGNARLIHEKRIGIDWVEDPEDRELITR